MQDNCNGDCEVYVRQSFELRISGEYGQAQEEPTPSNTVTLNWCSPVERVNGDALTHQEIGGYEIDLKHDTLDNRSIIVEHIVGQIEYSYTVENIVVADEWTMRIAAFDTDGIYSDYVGPREAEDDEEIVCAPL